MGKKIKGKKRHILGDTKSFPMQAIVHPAGIQDRDGGVRSMGALLGRYPCLLKLYADISCQGPKFRGELKKVCRKTNVETFKRTDVGKFVVKPKRWVVERTIGWLDRFRRLAKNWGCLNRNALAFLRWAAFCFMLRRLCQK